MMTRWPKSIFYDHRIQWKDIRVCSYADADHWKMSLRHVPTEAYVQGNGERYGNLRYKLFWELNQKVKIMSDCTKPR